jgi:hypothetical protein
MPQEEKLEALAMELIVVEDLNNLIQVLFAS